MITINTLLMLLMSYAGLPSDEIIATHVTTYLQEHALGDIKHAVMRVATTTVMVQISTEIPYNAGRSKITKNETYLVEYDKTKDEFKIDKMSRINMIFPDSFWDELYRTTILWSDTHGKDKD